MEQHRHLVQRRQPLFDQLFGAPPGDHFHAPDARRHAAFAYDAEGADLGSAVHMGAAAKLGADAFFLAKGDDPHLIAIFFGEERRHPFLERLFVARPAGIHRIVGQDDLVGPALDVAHFCVRQRLVVGKVEAQAIGRHQRAGLMHVCPQALAQGGMEHVGPRVVAHDVPAPVRVDGRLLPGHPPAPCPCVTLPTWTIMPGNGLRISVTATVQTGSSRSSGQ